MHQELESPEALRDAIKCFWYDRRDLDAELSGFEVIPDGYAEIIFHFGAGCSINVDGKLQQLPSPFMVGLLNQPVTFFSKDKLEIIGIRCFPWTVFDLLGLPSDKNSVHLFQHPIVQLHASLQALIAAGEVEQALHLTLKYFTDARLNVAAGTMLAKAGVAMRAANGTMPVSDVAAAAHATVRTLERNFKQSSGHTVKDVSALMRFEQVRNRLWHFPDTNLAGLAHELGYTDQAHLSKEFKRYTGTTPAAFARNARKGKPVLGTDFVAFIQS